MAGQTSRGAWVSYRVGDFDSVEVHSSEIKALRAAVTGGGAAVFVRHGQTLASAIKGEPPAPEGRIPGEDPLPDLDNLPPTPEPKPEPKQRSRKTTD